MDFLDQSLYHSRDAVLRRERIQRQKQPDRTLARVEERDGVR